MADDVSVRDLRKQAEALLRVTEEQGDDEKSRKLEQQIDILKMKEDAAILKPLKGLDAATAVDLAALKKSIADAKGAITKIQDRNRAVDKAMTIIATGIKIATKL